MIIGIIGGGQLGMMMAEAAKKYNHKVIGLDPNKNCSLSFVADEIIHANYNDKNAFFELVSKVDVITYEFENVDLELINNHLDIIPQKSLGLAKSRNRLTEKDFANSLEIPTVKYQKLNSIRDVFVPAIIKTTTGGYDGKGQIKVLDLSKFDEKLDFIHNEFIIEELIKFDYEISVIVSRDSFGNCVTYPIPINEHRNGILYLSRLDKDVNQKIKQKAISYTEQIITELDYVGTMAVEYFVKDENVIFNEFAPRPHNSGHYTIEGCTVSQFENHILAITKEKVKTPFLVNPTIMINVLGQDKAFVERSKDVECFVHSYHKSKTLQDRKMGHITIVSKDKKRLKEITNYIIKE